MTVSDDAVTTASNVHQRLKHNFLLMNSYTITLTGADMQLIADGLASLQANSKVSADFKKVLKVQLKLQKALLDSKKA